MVRSWLKALAVLFLLGAAPAVAQTPDAAVAHVPDTAAVEVDGIPLFQVRGASAFPAARRAAEIGQRIEAAAADPAFRPESLRATDRGVYTEISGGGHVVMRFVDADAELEDIARDQLAPAYLHRIQRAIADYRQARTQDALGRSVGRAAAAVGIALVVLALLLWLLRRGVRAMQHQFELRTGALTAASRQVLRVERLWQTLRSMILLTRAVLVLVVLLFLVEYVLVQFPQTRGIGRRMFGAIADPLADLGRGFVASIPNLIVLAILFVVTRYLLSLARLWFEAIEAGSLRYEGFEPDWARPTFGLVRLGIIGAALVTAYPFIPGSDSQAFQGLSILAGVLVAVGSSAAMSNIVAGYLILYRRAFSIGDRVKIGDSVGIVTEMRLQMTQLRTYRNEEINIPNALILTSEVTNFSQPARAGRLIVHSEVGIGYEVAWRQVEAMLLGAAQATPGLLPEPPPFVLQSRLGDFAVFYQVHAYTDLTEGVPQVMADLHRNILDQFNAQGVQIMTPAYEGDPEQPKVVPPDQWTAQLSPSPPPISDA